MGGREGGVRGPAFAQVIAVGIDQSGAVLRGPDEPVGLGGAGVAFDGVEREVQASGAFEQAHALISLVVDLLPALAGGLRVFALSDWWSQGRRAGAVRQGFPVCRRAEQVPQVPVVRDLRDMGCRVGDGLGEACWTVHPRGADTLIVADLLRIFDISKISRWPFLYPDTHSDTGTNTWIGWEPLHHFLERNRELPDQGMPREGGPV